MMKSLKKFGSILSVLFLFSCTTSPDMMENKGEADSAAASTSDQSGKEPEWVTVTEEEYFVSQETIKYGDDFIDGYRLFEYDENGHLMKQSQISSDESVISEELFYYEDELLIRSEFLSGGELTSQSVFSYNGAKELVEESFMNAAGDLQGVSAYEYDSSGRKIKWISGDNGGIPMMYTEYEYNKDLVSRISFFLPNGEMEGYTQMTYNEGLLMEEATYSASSKLEKKTEYVYEEGILARSLFYFGKNLSRTIAYIYDEKGNVVEERTLNRNGDLTDVVLKEYILIPVTKQILK